MRPKLFLRRKVKAWSTAKCQRYCYATVIAVRLTVVVFALMIPVTCELILVLAPDSAVEGVFARAYSFYRYLAPAIP